MNQYSRPARDRRNHHQPPLHLPRGLLGKGTFLQEIPTVPPIPGDRKMSYDKARGSETQDSLIERSHAL